MEYYVINHDKEEDFTSLELQRRCKFFGMDCSEFLFYHSETGPTDILEEASANCHLSITDCEKAGFVPNEWIRAKFRSAVGFHLEQYGDEDERRYEWMRYVSRALDEAGCGDVAEKWVELRG